MTLAAIGEGAERRGFVVLLLIAAVAGLVLLFYLDTFASMAGVWQSSNYRHGAIVFPISAYLLWRLRGPLATVELRPCAWGIGLLIGLVLLWFVARAVGVQSAEHLAAVLLIPATVLAFLGWAIARRALFPLLFLVAAVPVGDALVPHLMQVTADVSTALLQAAGVPVFRQGQFLSLPGGDFEVADVCAGLHYLTAGTVIALLFSYLTYQSNLKRLAFVVAMAIAMVVANGVRAFIVMFVASATDMRYLAGRDHVYFGWLLFGVIVVGLIYAGTRFADADAASKISAESGNAGRGRLLPLVLVLGLVMLAATAQPLNDDLGDSWLLLWPAAGLLLWALYRRFGSSSPTSANGSSGGISYRGYGGILVLSAASVVLAAGPFLVTSRASAVRLEPPLVDLPKIEECGAPSSWAAEWRPEFQSPDIVISGSYGCFGNPVNVFVAVYLDNTQGRELVSQENRLIPEAWWRFAAAGEHRFTAKNGQTIRVNEVHVKGPGAPALVWYWYSAGGEPVTGPVAVKLRQALQLLVHGRSDGNAYLLQTPLGGSLEVSRRSLAVAAREIEALETGGEVEDRT